MKYMLYHRCREVVKQVRCVQDRSPNQFQVGWNSSTVLIGVTNPVSPPHLALLVVEISLLPCTATIKEIFWLVNHTSKTYIFAPKNGGGIKWFEFPFKQLHKWFSGSTWIFSLSFVGGKKCRLTPQILTKWSEQRIATRRKLRKHQLHLRKMKISRRKCLNKCVRNR